MEKYYWDIDTLIKWLANRANNNEKKRINEVLEQDKDLKQDFREIRLGAEAYLRSDPYKRAKNSWQIFKKKLDAIPEEEESQFWYQRFQIPHSIQRSLKIAALLVLTTISSYLAYRYLMDDIISFVSQSNRQVMVISSERAHQKKISLSDGSLIYLAPGSTFKLPKKSEEQHITHLIGEAYFEIVHNEANPFYVYAAGRKIKVLGTKFNLEAWPGSDFVKLTVLEGKVSFEVEDRHERVSLLIDEGEMCFSEKGETPRIRKVENVEKLISWRSGKLSFEHTMLKDVLNKIEYFYDVDFVTGMYPELLNGKLTATFPKSSLDDLLENLCLLINKQWIRKNKQVYFEKALSSQDSYPKIKQKKPEDIIRFKNPVVSISIIKKSLLEVFHKLEHISGCHINYADNLLMNFDNISYQVEEVPLNQILIDLLRDTNISYYISDRNTVFLIKKDIANRYMGTIRGVVFNQLTQVARQGVKVSIEGADYQCLSRENGFFELPNLFPGEYVLTVYHKDIPVMKQPLTVKAGIVEFIDIYL